MRFVFTRGKGRWRENLMKVIKLYKVQYYKVNKH